MMTNAERKANQELSRLDEAYRTGRLSREDYGYRRRMVLQKLCEDGNSITARHAIDATTTATAPATSTTTFPSGLSGQEWPGQVPWGRYLLVACFISIIVLACLMWLGN